MTITYDVETPNYDEVSVKGSFAMDAYGVTDAYGWGFTAERQDVGEVEVTLDFGVSKILHASGSFWTSTVKVLVPQVVFPAPTEGTNDTVRFRFLDAAGDETELAAEDRFSFEITALISSY